MNNGTYRLKKFFNHAQFQVESEEEVLKALKKRSIQICYGKYNSTLDSLYNLLITRLMKNKKSLYTVRYKEAMIMISEREYLKRFYLITDSFKRLPDVLKLWVNHRRLFPIYTILKERKYLYQNILRKQRLLDRIKKLNTKRSDKLDDSEKDIFNTEVMKSIIDEENDNDSVIYKRSMFLNSHREFNDSISSIENLINMIISVEDDINNANDKDKVFANKTRKFVFAHRKQEALDKAIKMNFKGINFGGRNRGFLIRSSSAFTINLPDSMTHRSKIEKDLENKSIIKSEIKSKITPKIKSELLSGIKSEINTERSEIKTFSARNTIAKEEHNLPKVHQPLINVMEKEAPIKIIKFAKNEDFIIKKNYPFKSVVEENHRFSMPPNKPLSALLRVLEKNKMLKNNIEIRSKTPNVVSNFNSYNKAKLNNDKKKETPIKSKKFMFNLNRNFMSSSEMMKLKSVIKKNE